MILAFITILNERPKISVALKKKSKERYLELELLIALPPTPLMKSYHQGWLIEIQFTRPCSFECLSRCTGLVTLQTLKQMPALPGQNYFNVSYWEVITVRSPWRTVNGGGWEKPTSKWSVSCQFSLSLFQFQWSTLVDKLLIEWCMTKNKKNQNNPPATYRAIWGERTTCVL